MNLMDCLSFSINFSIFNYGLSPRALFLRKPMRAERGNPGSRSGRSGVSPVSSSIPKTR